MLVVSVLVAVGTVTILVLAVLMLSLVRHMRLLAGALRQFQQEVQPVLREIQRGSVEAQERMERLDDRRTKPGAGGRLGR